VFACSSPISSLPSSSCGKKFREMQTQTESHSPIRKTVCMCAYCQVPICSRNNESCACCPSFATAVLQPYLHPNQISTCCGFDPAAGVRMPATRFPLCSQSLSLCYGPCLGPAPPPVHGHHLPMTFCQPQQQPGGCVVRRLPHHGSSFQTASAEFH
jgi:hypothetical protein